VVNESEVLLVKDVIQASTLIKAFRDKRDESANMEAIKTGFDVLDEYLGGGLFDGLYAIGAVSSLGKTTFVLQIADYIAEKGTDVLIFSLEMSKFELMAKSISRNTCILSMKNGAVNDSLAKTVRDITQGSIYKDYNESVKNLIENAEKEYEKIAKNIYICEGVGDISVADIRHITEQHINKTGRRPVIIIDYLQILAPGKGSERSTDKQNMDKAIVELKRLSRDKNIPVIAISSMNRESNKKDGRDKVNNNDSFDWDTEMTGFKESGCIEYSCDVLIKLKATNDKSEDIRDISLIILKNRNGKITDKPRYWYYTKYNYFTKKSFRV
jgi:replicative DNA helicase